MGTQHMTPEGAREAALWNFYRLQRRVGSCPIEATELMGDFAKRLDMLDAERAADLKVIEQCIKGVRHERR